MDLGKRPLVKVMMTFDPETPVSGPRMVFFMALLDSGADITVIATDDWPQEWPKTFTWRVLTGVGGEVSTCMADAGVKLSLIGRDGSIERTVFTTPTIAPISGSILGRDVLLQLGVQLTNL